MFDVCQVKREGKAREYNDYAPTLAARDYKDPRLVNDNVIKQVGNYQSGGWDNPQVGRVYSPDGLSPTLNTMQGGDRQPKIIEGEEKINSFKIRKLTPKECFRLMGFTDEDYENAKSVGISNSQLYKQSGNSIVVDVLFYILLELYKAMPYLFDDLKLSSFFSGIGAFEKALDRLYKYINTGEEVIKNKLPVTTNELLFIGGLGGKHEQSNRVYDEDGICPTVMSGSRRICTGGYISPKILVRDNGIGESDIKQKNF